MSLATSASTTLKQVTTVLFSDEYSTSTSLASCLSELAVSDKTFSQQNNAVELAFGLIIASVVCLF
jgi:hypothetical protein